MTARHTPGPWQYAFEGATRAFITEADGTTVVAIRTTENSTAHRNLANNARLIAAAPDLLSALESCLAHLSNVYDGYPESTASRAAKPAIQIARAAITKATGA